MTGHLLSPLFSSFLTTTLVSCSSLESQVRTFWILVRHIPADPTQRGYSRLAVWYRAVSPTSSRAVYTLYYARQRQRSPAAHFNSSCSAPPVGARSASAIGHAWRMAWPCMRRRQGYSIGVVRLKRHAGVQMSHTVH